METMFNYFDQIDSVSTDHYEQVINRLSDTFRSAVLLSGLNGIFHFVSKNTLSMLGYSREEILGKYLLNFMHENDFPIVELICQLPFNENNKKTFSARLRRKDETFMNADIIIHKIKHSSNLSKSEYLYVIKENDHNKDFETLNPVTLVQFAAGIAHEIRNPLTSLKGFIQLMKSDQSYNEQYLKIMEDELNNIEIKSNELMLAAKPNQYRFSEYSLNQITENSLALLEREFLDNQIEIKRDYACEPVLVYCDEQKIKQVIVNLIKNATEAIDGPGLISITINKNENYGSVSIQDSGSGISEETLNEIGKPFFTTKAYGHGLGLMMCYKIIEDHNGKITVDSEINKGTVFTVSLPLNEKK